MKPQNIETQTPVPPSWVAGDAILSHLWQSSLTWRIEMLRANESIDHSSEIERITRLAHEHDLTKATITLSEAERRWRKTNLRQNPPHLPFRWKSDDGRGTWLTTTYAMETSFGPEPTNVAQ